MTKMIHQTLAQTIFLCLFALWAHSAFAQKLRNDNPLTSSQSDLYITPKPLGLPLRNPTTQKIFVHFTYMGVDRFAGNKGALRQTYGAALGVSASLFESKNTRLRAGFDAQIAYGRKNGDEERNKSLDGLALGVLDLDWKAKIFQPFIGIGGGYNYLFDKRVAQGNEAAIDDEDDVFVLYARGGFNFRPSVQSPWSITMAYGYVYGIDRMSLDSRPRPINISNHRVYLGFRFGF